MGKLFFIDLLKDAISPSLLPDLKLFIHKYILQVLSFHSSEEIDRSLWAKKRFPSLIYCH